MRWVVGLRGDRFDGKGDEVGRDDGRHERSGDNGDGRRVIGSAEGDDDRREEDEGEGDKREEKHRVVTGSKGEENKGGETMQ